MLEQPSQPFLTLDLTERRVVVERRRHVLPSTVYNTGNLILWAGCEGVSFFAMVIMLLLRSFWPTIVVAAVAIRSRC